MEANLVQQGIDLMLFGMTTVFVFLSVLVVSTTLMSAIVTRFFPDLVVPESAFKPAKKITGGEGVDPKVLAVIQEAVYQHRAKTK